jgi:hypothetical protein
MNRERAIDEMFNATVGAMTGEDLSHYPVGVDRRKIPVHEVIKAMNDELQKMDFANAEDTATYLERAQASYEEVKSATEYQDQKTARLLTILAFLTAAAGTIFSKIFDRYSLTKLDHLSLATGLVGLTYILFAAYFLMIATGALISFYAMQTRFKESEVATEKLRSLLFFKYIAITEPRAWARQFTVHANELTATYIRHYVIETYILATKASDKVRFLQPAQDMLQNAIKVLVVWILVLAITMATVQP